MAEDRRIWDGVHGWRRSADTEGQGMEGFVSEKDLVSDVWLDRQLEINGGWEVYVAKT